MSIKDITQAKLDSFYGTETYRWSDFKKLKLTDGAQFLQDNGAAWLIGAIESWQHNSDMTSLPKDIEFQVWELIVIRNIGDRSGTAILTCHEDAGEPTLVKQEISYTDFPLDSIKLYVQNGVLLLPSEY